MDEHDIECDGDELQLKINYISSTLVKEYNDIKNVYTIPEEGSKYEGWYVIPCANMGYYNGRGIACDVATEWGEYEKFINKFSFPTK